MILDWSSRTVGVLVLLVLLRDLFHTLGHPTSEGTLSRAVMGTTWRLTRAVPVRSVSSSAGPLAMVAVISAWTAVAVAGWALLYWPSMPEGFSYSPGIEERQSVLDAVYLSMVTLSTVGFGEVVPLDGWLRVTAALQALFGFALLTAAVSWLLQIYPALTRRRLLGARIDLLRRAGASDVLPGLDSASGAVTLQELAVGVAQVRIDLDSHSETYYFGGTRADGALPVHLGHAAELARAGSRSTRPDVRLAAAALREALADLAALLDEDFLHTGAPTAEVFEHWARQYEQSS